MYDAEERNFEKEKEYEKLFSSQLVVYNMGVQRIVELQKELRDRYKKMKERLDSVVDTLQSSIDYIKEKEEKRGEAFAKIEENEIQLEEFVKKAQKLKAVMVIEVKDSPPKPTKHESCSVPSDPPELVRMSLLPEGKFDQKVCDVVTKSLKDAIEKDGKAMMVSEACEDCLKECDKLDFCVHSKKKKQLETSTSSSTMKPHEEPEGTSSKI